MSHQKGSSGKSVEHNTKSDDQAIISLINENKKLISDRKQITENLGCTSFKNVFRHNIDSCKGK